MARKQALKPRVFCVGWHKTGTTTLGLALLQLGYSVVGCRMDMVHPLVRGDLETVIRTAGEFDALQDIPWAALFRELDAAYPGSKFILLERDEESWLASATRHFKDAEIPLHKWLYGEGRLAGNEALYLERFRRHNREVKAYFADRPRDLLVMKLADGDSWPLLCEFLDCPVPTARFPHENKGPQSWTGQDRMVHAARRFIPEVIRKQVFAIRLAFRRWTGRPDPRDRFNNYNENRRERARHKVEI